MESLSLGQPAAMRCAVGAGIKRSRRGRWLSALFLLAPFLPAAAVISLSAVTAAPARGQCSPPEIAQLIASDAADQDHFGLSVAIDGDTAVVGADLAGVDKTGSAYVFVRSGDVWTEQANLTASDAAAYTVFGVSVALSGDTAVVGSALGGASAGSAYVFVRIGGNWTEQAKLTASDGAPNDHFGESVALSGNTVVVGAWYSDAPVGNDAGSAYVFVKPPGGWSDMTETAKLSASDPVANDYFGVSVAVSDDTVVVGAFGDWPTGGGRSGSAYVFVPSGGGWSEQAKLTISGLAPDDWFGRSVAVSGDTVLVGAYGDDLPGAASAGSAYVFIRSGGVWTQEAMLTASDAATGDLFGGFSVALSGDTAVVSALYADNASATDAGSAYVFVRSGSLWTEQAKLTASDAAANDLFSNSVALSGNTVVVGAFHDDHAGGIDAGSAYVFDIACGACCEAHQCHEAHPADCTPFVCSVAQYMLPTFHGCFGDVDGNGVVNPGDRGGVSANIGREEYVLICVFDLDGNGVINPGDRGVVSANIGGCAPLPDYQNGSSLNRGVPDPRFAATFMGVGTTCGAVTCP